MMLIEFTVKLGDATYKSGSYEALYPMTVEFQGETKTTYLDDDDRIRLTHMIEELKEAFEAFEVPQ
jgi:hypothetical protein